MSSVPFPCIAEHRTLLARSGLLMIECSEVALFPSTTVGWRQLLLNHHTENQPSPQYTRQRSTAHLDTFSALWQCWLWNPGSHYRKKTTAPAPHSPFLCVSSHFPVVGSIFKCPRRGGSAVPPWPLGFPQQPVQCGLSSHRCCAAPRTAS